MSVKALNIVNRKASFEYHTDQKYVAGVILSGAEVKSVRAGHVNISDAYCMMEDGELYVKNLHISEYKNGFFEKQEPLRNRKLLLNKQELRKIDSKIKTKGIAVFPVRLFSSDTGYIKLEIGVGPGKKSFDKRDDIKQKDIERELSRIKF